MAVGLLVGIVPHFAAVVVARVGDGSRAQGGAKAIFLLPPASLSPQGEAFGQAAGSGLAWPGLAGPSLAG